MLTIFRIMGFLFTRTNTKVFRKIQVLIVVLMIYFKFFGFCKVDAKEIGKTNQTCIGSANYFDQKVFKNKVINFNSGLSEQTTNKSIAAGIDFWVYSIVNISKIFAIKQHSFSEDSMLWKLIYHGSTGFFSEDQIKDNQLHEKICETERWNLKNNKINLGQFVLCGFNSVYNDNKFFLTSDNDFKLINLSGFLESLQIASREKPEIQLSSSLLYLCPEIKESFSIGKLIPFDSIRGSVYATFSGNSGSFFSNCSESFSRYFGYNSNKSINKASRYSIRNLCNLERKSFSRKTQNNIFMYNELRLFKKNNVELTSYLSSTNELRIRKPPLSNKFLLLKSRKFKYKDFLKKAKIAFQSKKPTQPSLKKRLSINDVVEFSLQKFISSLFPYDLNSAVKTGKELVPYRPVGQKSNKQKFGERIMITPMSEQSRWFKLRWGWFWKSGRNYQLNKFKFKKFPMNSFIRKRRKFFAKGILSNKKHLVLRLENFGSDFSSYHSSGFTKSYNRSFFNHNSTEDNYLGGLDFFNFVSKQYLPFNEIECINFFAKIFVIYYNVPKSYYESFRFYRKTAFLGNFKGNSNLSDMFFFGLGVRKSKKNSLKLAESSTKRGSTKGLFYVLNFLKKGIETTIDSTRYVKLIKKIEISTFKRKGKKKRATKKQLNARSKNFFAFLKDLCEVSMIKVFIYSLISSPQTFFTGFIQNNCRLIEYSIRNFRKSSVQGSYLSVLKTTELLSENRQLFLSVEILKEFNNFYSPWKNFYFMFKYYISGGFFIDLQAKNLNCISLYNNDVEIFKKMIVIFSRFLSTVNFTLFYIRNFICYFP